MPEYDFLILQPNEFECLTRDLLQKKEKVFVESFTTGRDGGIDLRFAKIRGANSIVQCKRYSSFRELFNKLIKEVDKVKQISPSRYILSTSVGLTPANKDMIMELFAGQIKRTEDIIGRDDLNNLLGQFPDIEKKYYKLWLASTAVLESIINRRIENWSGFEIDEINRDVSTYVMNDSFTEALKILQDNRYVIISGIPGIGKTTLARMLVLYILSGGYEEFVKVTTMDDAAQKYIGGRKQVFYFDDFLGANFFDVHEVGFEDKILSFIQRVRRTTDKLFILSTREYILSSARLQFEKFGLKNIEMAKCTIEMSKYSEEIRAKILYNHLSEARLPDSYIEAILKDNQYLKIIKHRNFNPRIIEAFLSKSLYNQTDPNQFVKRFLDFFDRPFSVWEFAFRRLSLLAQYALFVLLSIGGCSYLKDWYHATEVFLIGVNNEIHIELTEAKWREILDVLQGSFIILNNFSKQIVEFHNPSVYDFIIDYLRKLPQTQRLIVENSVFCDQIFNVFTDRDLMNGSSGRICVPLEWAPIIIATINRGYNNLTSAKLVRGNDSYSPTSMNKAKYLLAALNSFPIIIRNNPAFIESKVIKTLALDSKIDLLDRIELLSNIDAEQFGIDIKELIPLLIKEINFSYELYCFLSMLDDKKLLSEFFADDSFNQMINDVINYEISALSSKEEAEDLENDISGICSFIPSLDEAYLLDTIESKFPADNTPEDPDYDEDWAREAYYSSKSLSIDSYGEMFSSLLGQ